jgi:TonB family protein
LFNFGNPYSSSYINNEGLLTINLKEIVINSEIQNTFFGLPLFTLLGRVYLFASLALVFFFSFKLVRLLLLIKKSKTTTLNGIKFVLLNNSLPTFSFFNYVFIQKELFKNHSESKKIIEHESIHLLQRHSIDLILAELLIILQWFNPIAYLIRNSIKENHEFLADKGIIENDLDVSEYKLLLLRNSTKIGTGSLTHNFSYSLIKKRFTMMEKKDSKIKLILGMMILPLAFSLALLACNSPEKEEIQVVNTNKDVEIQKEETPEIAKEVMEETVFTVVEDMPKYMGGVNELYKFLGNNIKYPQEAKTAGISGHVFVSFIVEKDGEVTNVKVLRGIGHGCDKEAIRVVESMPNWVPGKQSGKNVRVAYNLPIKYSLN